MITIVYDAENDLFKITGNCTITAQLTDEAPK